VGGFAFGTVVRAISNTGVCKIAKRTEVVEYVLPMPLVTWNRVLSMHHYQRKKLRDLTDMIVEAVVNDTEVDEIWVMEYMAISRPSKKNRKALSDARLARKRKR
jgi:hypothetical protein